MRNPLTPRTPNTPPWDPEATASGVYVTDDFLRAADYAYMIAEDTGSEPIVIGVDATGLVKHPDPQVRDLLAEPYDEYRRNLLNYLRSEYYDTILQLREQGLSQEQRRETLGTFHDYAQKQVTSPRKYFRPARPSYAGIDKTFAAEAILPRSESWMPLIHFHRIYGSKAPEQIWRWLNWQSFLDEEVGVYSTDSLYCAGKSEVPAAVYNSASNMFYFDDLIDLGRITRIWTLDVEGHKHLLLEQKRSPDEVYHGTSSSRLKEIFPTI